jgi:hypothetical protein
MRKSEPLYAAAVAQAILEVAAESMIGNIFCIDERGVWIDAPVSAFGNWHPAMEIDAPGSPDPLSEPSLPFPFTSRQLAAFALSGMGRFVADCFFGDGPFFQTGEGPWGDDAEQLDDMLGRLPARAIKAREALLEARKAYQAAAVSVRPPSVGAKVEGGHEDELARWRKDLCHALLGPQASGPLLVADSSRTPRLKRVSAMEAHASVITDALVRHDYDPLNLPPRPPGKSYRPKQVAKAAMVKKGAFAKTWQWMLDEKRLVVRP